MAEVHPVTGGAGYFGSLLVERLVQTGRKVRVFDIAEIDGDMPVDWIRADIRDERAVARACEGVAVVHHNVALVPLAKDKDAFYAVNRDGTRNVLSAARAAHVRKVVHMSSSAVFGAPATNPGDESTQPRPQEDYGRAKQQAEALCLEESARGLDLTIIRPRTILGHGRLGIMQSLFEWVRRGRNVSVFDGGDNVYQFVHASDLADACLRAADRPGPRVYNIGAKRFGTMKQTLTGLIQYAKTGSAVVSVPSAPMQAMMKVTSKLGLSPLGPYHALMYGRSMYFDTTRAETELGWSARFGNVEMICESYEWYLAHRADVLGRTGASHHRSPVRQGVLRAASLALSFAHRV
jgi:nucleoside-diphosphate-sugar epimerase